MIGIRQINSTCFMFDIFSFTWYSFLLKFVVDGSLIESDDDDDHDKLDIFCEVLFSGVYKPKLLFCLSTGVPGSSSFLLPPSALFLIKIGSRLFNFLIPSSDSLYQ